MAITENSPKTTEKQPNGSIRRSKVAVGINVTVAILAAGALVILLNYLVQYASGRGGLRKDFQTLGQYGLSDRTRKILDQVDQPVQVTVIYTSTDKQRSGKKFGPRVAELCQDMARRNGDIAVTVASDDQAKADVLARVRKNADAQAKPHLELIQKFQDFAADTSQLLGQESVRWNGLQSAATLAELRLPATIATTIDQAKSQLDLAREEISRAGESSGVPDYTLLAERATGTAKDLGEGLKIFDDTLREVARLQQAVVAEDGKVLKDAQAAQARLDQASKDFLAVLGAPKDPIPASPAEALRKFVAAGKTLDGELRAQRDATQKFAKQYQAVMLHQNFTVAVGTDSGVRNSKIPEMYGLLSQMVSNTCAQAQEVADKEAEHVQKTMIEDLRTLTARMPQMISSAGKQWNDLLTSMAKVDPASKKVLDSAQTGAFASVVKSANEITEAGSKLPKLDQGNLSQQLSEDNIVLLEAGGKAAVLDFDTVWPTARLQSAKEDEDGPRRVFNGDQAIAGQLLELTHKPFAEVVVTYFQFNPPQQLRGQIPPVVGDLPREQLQVLTESLKKARLEVIDWNLAGNPMAGDKIPDLPPAKDGVPRILLILPPPPDMSGMQQMQLPSFTDKHLKKITDVIDAGTPAIVLTGNSPRALMAQQTQDDPLAKYLRESWGLEIKNRLRVIQGFPNPRQPGKFDLGLINWYWLPLSDFTDDPIGKPLRARQLHWLNLCPVVQADTLPGGVRLDPIMRVSAGTRDIWATAQTMELIEKVYGGEALNVQPDTQAGDMLPPFTTAMLASKGNNRVLVAGLGLTYINEYLSTPTRRMKPSGAVASDPPPMGATDLLVNACYSLSGNAEYIGAGPSDVAPVGDIAPGRLVAMQWLVVGAWPALVLAAGVLVMMIRRR